jgi:hypothetical protein
VSRSSRCRSTTPPDQPRHPNSGIARSRASEGSIGGTKAGELSTWRTARIYARFRGLRVSGSCSDALGRRKSPLPPAAAISSAAGSPNDEVVAHVVRAAKAIGGPMLLGDAMRGEGCNRRSVRRVQRDIGSSMAIAGDREVRGPTPILARR